MQIRVRQDQMEEVEGMSSQYPYAYHHVDLSKTLIPWHWHEALEFNFVAQGRVKVSTAGKSLTFRQGEGFFINSNVLATMTAEEGCILDSHLFHPVLLSGHFNSVFETKYLHPITQNRQIEVVAFRERTTILEKLRQLSALQKKEHVEFQTRNLLSELWLLLLEEVRKLEVSATGSDLRNRDRILTMLSFIQENYTQKLTLEDIAGAAAVSTRECLRCFRTSIGQSPTDYLISYRVEAARRLLESTRLPVTEVALRTGWGSSAYFGKIFRRITGRTPAEYRKSLSALQEPAI